MIDFDVEIAQLTPFVGDRAANAERIIKVVQESRADLIVFGELSATGYSYDLDFRSMAGRIDGLKEVARREKKHIVYGTPILEEGRLYNSLVLVTPKGDEIYRKIHLPHFGPFREKDFFSEGGEVKVEDTDLGRIGLMICYDISFPELARTLMVKGAEVVICISASPPQSRPFFEKVLPARAAENSSFLVYVNLCGFQRKLQFWGGSGVYDPWGKEMARAKYMEEDRVVIHLDRKDLENAREQRPMKRDVKDWLLPAIGRRV